MATGLALLSPRRVAVRARKQQRRHYGAWTDARTPHPSVGPGLEYFESKNVEPTTEAGGWAVERAGEALARDP